MIKNYLKTNLKFFQRPYYANNVDSYIWRLKSHILDKYINPNKKLRILDYGCGEGSNLEYFLKNYQYDCYGVDTSVNAVNVCKKKKLKNIILIKSNVEKNDDFFNKKFDLIISINTLYYLNKYDLQKRLKSFENVLKPNGYVFFTMVSVKSKFFTKCSNKIISEDSLTKVNFLKDKNFKDKENYYQYINFAKSEKDLISKFKIFKKLKVGFYDQSLNDINESIHHYTFFGKKRSI